MSIVCIYLETGVSVEVPVGVDPATDEGVAVIKKLAQAKFIERLTSGDFDVTVETDLDD